MGALRGEGRKFSQPSSNPKKECFQAIHKAGGSIPGTQKGGCLWVPGNLQEGWLQVTQTSWAAKWTDLNTTSHLPNFPLGWPDPPALPLSNLSFLSCQVATPPPPSPQHTCEWNPSLKTQWKISFSFMTLLKTHTLHSSLTQHWPRAASCPTPAQQTHSRDMRASGAAEKSEFSASTLLGSSKH